jgi:hypothetical protein
MIGRLRTPQPRIRSLLAITLVIALVLAPFIHSTPAQALSGAEFQSGRIIDDALFYNAGSMSLGDIQNFLNSKVPTCDTNGTQMHSSGQTRAAYSASQGVSTPFICLKSFRQDTPSRGAESNLCNGFGGGNLSAAEIIYHISNSCGISPKVLIILLQKEQSLVTDDWPWPIQYRSATGYGCPDTAPCDAEYYGFFNQVYTAAKQFKRYARDAPNFNTQPGRNNAVQYHPNAGCGNSTISVQNFATAGLYNYTPYQPNQASLGNLYGSGDGCSSYGNRNFWRLYTEWFGSTIGCAMYDTSFVHRLFRPGDGGYLFTNNSAEICQAVKYAGFAVDGPAMKTVYATDVDARSLFRLSRNGIYLFTTNVTEMQNAMQYGYRYEGVAYYVSATQKAGYYAVHRLSKDGRYILTISQKEKDSYQASGFQYEGVVFYVPSAGTKVPVYRLTKNGQHLYTSSAVERDLAMSQNGYTSEGIGFYGQSGLTGDTLTVFRMERRGRYLFTSNINERFGAMQAYYRQEMSDFYVYDGNYPGTVPVYRLSNSSNGDYLYTIVPTERDAAVRQYGYRDEGVVFNGAP